MILEPRTLLKNTLVEGSNVFGYFRRRRGVSKFDLLPHTSAFFDAGSLKRKKNEEEEKKEQQRKRRALAARTYI
jgi:hypothetical protein